MKHIFYVLYTLSVRQKVVEIMEQGPSPCVHISWFVSSVTSEWYVGRRKVVEVMEQGRL
jgi:hypothetical protein